MFYISRKLALGFTLAVAICCLHGALSVLYAQYDATPAQINQLEQTVYGQTYPQMPEEERLGRLENTVFYGGSQLKKRWIDTVQLPKALAGLITPNHGDPVPTEQRIQALRLALSRNAANTQTPARHHPLQMLDYLEQRLFNTTFSQQPVPQRLDRLEGSVFGHHPEPFAAPSDQIRLGESRTGLEKKLDLSPVSLTMENLSHPVVTPIRVLPPHPVLMDRSGSAEPTGVDPQALEPLLQQRLQRLLYAVPLNPRAVSLKNSNQR